MIDVEMGVITSNERNIPSFILLLFLFAEYILEQNNKKEKEKNKIK